VLAQWWLIGEPVPGTPPTPHNYPGKADLTGVPCPPTPPDGGRGMMFTSVAFDACSDALKHHYEMKNRLYPYFEKEAEKRAQKEAEKKAAEEMYDKEDEERAQKRALKRAQKMAQKDESEDEIEDEIEDDDKEQGEVKSEDEGPRRQVRTHLLTAALAREVVKLRADLALLRNMKRNESLDQPFLNKMIDDTIVKYEYYLDKYGVDAPVPPDTAEPNMVAFRIRLRAVNAMEGADKRRELERIRAMITISSYSRPAKRQKINDENEDEIEEDENEDDEEQGECEEQGEDE